MAPSSNQGKRVKGKQVARPFVYGTTARPFDPDKNPKPAHVPDEHTHSWTVFVKGVDDVDVTYWLKRVQFKLHESIPNHVRMIDGEPGKPFVVHETGWGEFEITIKMYYVQESGEKAQTLYHHLRLHAYGSDAEKAAMVANGEVVSWIYEEQLFNEPYEHFFDILTTGALPPSDPNFTAPAPGGKKGGKGGKGAAGQAKGAGDVVEKMTEGGVRERSAMIPQKSRPGQPFSKEAEDLEMGIIKEAMEKVAKMMKEVEQDTTSKQNHLKQLKESGKEESAMK